MNDLHLVVQGAVWRVGALCNAIADALDLRFNPVTVRGEISGFSRAVSGHCYFTLKDESGQIRCAMFRRAASTLNFPPQDGELVELIGRVGVYEPRGDLQLVVEGMRRSGTGVWFEQFLRLKAKLEAQGLFESQRKRPLPVMPRGIGVVTSLGAAALHDVLSALQRRVAHIPVVIAPAAVQGADAPGELIAALSKLYAFTEAGSGAASVSKEMACRIDVILLVRGGGAMEDMWAFNNEDLARVIAQSPVPIITGLGHETDFTIADFVADVRAPTPTAAAELVSEPRSYYLNAVDVLQERLNFAILRSLDTQSQRLDMVAASLGRPSSQLNQRSLTLMSSAQRLKSAVQLHLHSKSQNLQQFQVRLPERMQQCQRHQRERLDRIATGLDLLDPSLVLKRGYAWVNRVDDIAKPVMSSQGLSIGQALDIHLAYGRLSATVTKLQ